ncbi:MAG: aldo/keto reductase [Oscillospiraceae bacterium]|jgi:predicted aldo/keto reductase-like oxidoreductase|nr:aldo/keto reductase [Oscillospiraceae bacterium]
MKQVILGTTGITTPQNAFGALPIQRVERTAAVALLRRAYDGGMTFFDTARAYSDSEEKLGQAFDGMRQKLFLASKTAAKTPAEFHKDLETSLANLRTDYLDIYQFHMASACYRPGDGTGLYECMQEAKKSGKIRHIGITAHKIGIAEEIVASGLYETLQFPFSYLSSARELALAAQCEQANMGLIAMKALAGGLITHSAAAFAFISQYHSVLPIWGIQREAELTQWLSFFDVPAAMNAEIAAFIAREQAELHGDFCRGCGYCLPCPAGILIHQCARMSLMLRRAPSVAWLAPDMQLEMEKIKNCIHCGACRKKCPYALDIPTLLQKNYADYRQILRAERILAD